MGMIAASIRTVATMRLEEEPRVGRVAAEQERAAFASDDVAVVAAIRVAAEPRAPVLHLDRPHVHVAARSIDAR